MPPTPLPPAETRRAHPLVAAGCGFLLVCAGLSMLMLCAAAILRLHPQVLG